MTAELRRAHRRIWLALAVLLPVLFVAAIWLRPGELPANADLAEERMR